MSVMQWALSSETRSNNCLSTVAAVRACISLDEGDNQGRFFFFNIDDSKMNRHCIRRGVYWSLKSFRPVAIHSQELIACFGGWNRPKSYRCVAQVVVQSRQRVASSVSSQDRLIRIDGETGTAKRRPGQNAASARRRAALAVISPQTRRALQSCRNARLYYSLILLTLYLSTE